MNGRESNPPAEDPAIWGTGPAALEPRPHIVGEHTHGIRRAQIHPHAQFIVERLRRAGYHALLVGGAVRDLLLKRAPKDFDVVTSATPEQVRRLFQNARVIGRRFRLVLLRFGDMKVEVSTFRGPVKKTQGGMIHRDNTYGTPREDAFRRDFTVNALMFDPHAMTLVDYVGGLEDLTARRIRTITPPQVSFTEDPVRMLRSIRFSNRLGFPLDAVVRAAIRPMAGQLALVTRHRLADELQRFLTAGDARAVFAEFHRLGLLTPLLGIAGHEWFFSPAALAQPLEALGPCLEAFDAWVAAGREKLPPTVTLLAALLVLARPPLAGRLMGTLSNHDEERRYLRAVESRLPATLGDWGLLRGQVEPALRILDGARRLLAGAPERGVPARLGDREAWLLLGVLADHLNVSPETVEYGMSQVPLLPDLPILDHPRPAHRKDVPDSASKAAGTAVPPAARRRRRR
jgi:tRNA nucleotidyltransferase/poly(A) polymerase